MITAMDQLEGKLEIKFSEHGMKLEDGSLKMRDLYKALYRAFEILRDMTRFPKVTN